MTTSANSVAIVTARAGSKRIPGKNIRPFHGKPLVVWTIETLVQSQLFSQVVISTDSPEIASIADGAGATTPFLRPERLADDFSTTADVANHAIEILEAKGAPADTLYCVVYPAAVAMTKVDLFESRNLLISGGFDFVFVGHKLPASPYRAWKRGANAEATAAFPEFESLRTQDLETLYQDAGQFYWTGRDGWRRISQGQPVRRGIWEVARSRAIDIDDEEDWKIAEALFSASNPNSSASQNHFNLTNREFKLPDRAINCDL